MQYQSYNYKLIKPFDIIRYTARQSNNKADPYKPRDFLVSRIDNDSTLTLIPITHSGYDPNSNNPNNSKFKSDPMSMFNVKFPDLLQIQLNKATNTTQTSFFNTNQMFHIDQKQLAQADLKYVASFKKSASIVNKTLIQIRKNQYDITNRNIDFQNEMSGNTFYNQSTINYNCRHGIWIDNDTLSKMSIASDINPDIKPKYPLNLHPVREPKIEPQNINDFEY